MADETKPKYGTVGSTEPSRRDFMTMATIGMGAIGGAAALWPFLSSLNPSADTLAVSSTEVDVSSLEVGQSLTAIWRKSPVFIRRRTAEEIEKARSVALTDLKDQADAPNDEDRVLGGNPEWLVLVGVCTHLGCTPSGQKVTDDRGDFGGWYCPCHGSHYDTSGRIRKGPAPSNLPVPPSAFINDTTIKIG
ncbi:MAG: ubiquinol-cytochrome c reductase iron-sulfur subunit [Alphaproteobacteria bacterium]